MSAQIQHLPKAMAHERVMQLVRQNPVLYRELRQMFVDRREVVRHALDLSSGEVAIVNRGRSLELTTIINDLFPEWKEKPDGQA